MIVSGNSFFDSNSPQSPSNLIFDNFGNYEAFRSFNLKLEQLSCQKVLHFVLLDNCFTDLFTEVQIPYGQAFKFCPGRFLERQSKFQPIYDWFYQLELLIKT